MRFFLVLLLPAVLEAELKAVWNGNTGWSLVATCGGTNGTACPPGGSRTALDPRFLALFSVVCLPRPSTSVLARIFGSLLRGHFAAPYFDDSVVGAAARATEVVVGLCNFLDAQVRARAARRTVGRLRAAVRWQRPTCFFPTP